MFSPRRTLLSRPQQSKVRSLQARRYVRCCISVNTWCIGHSGHETPDGTANWRVRSPQQSQQVQLSVDANAAAKAAPAAQASPSKAKECIYVGIDFGTSRSGYAFAFGADSAPQLHFSWPGETVQQAKTLTALLYDVKTWEPLAWGMEAYKQ